MPVPGSLLWFYDVVCPTGPPQDFLQSFKDLLAKGGIQRPDGATLNRIVQHYSNRLMVASTVDTALQLYEDVRNVPGTFTEQQIKTQVCSCLTILGTVPCPCSTSPASLKANPQW